MKQLNEWKKISYVCEIKDSLCMYWKNALIALLMMTPVTMQAQDIQVKANAIPMIGMNMETKKMMIGANLELISLGNDQRRVGGGINPAVYFDENISGKLWPSLQVTRKFGKGTEIRAILGGHGWDTFIGVGGKVTL